MINNIHNDFFDSFFRYFTFLGDGLFALIIVIILLFIQVRKAIYVGLASLSASVITQLIKHILFEGSARPKTFFKDIQELYFVPGFDVHAYNTFPSGHSTTAFALFLTLAYFSKKNSEKFICFLLALGVAYSRVYLSQHFFADVYVGSIIGSCFAILIIHGMSITPSIDQKSWMEKSILKR